MPSFLHHLDKSTYFSYHRTREFAVLPVDLVQIEPRDDVEHGPREGLPHAVGEGGRGGHGGRAGVHGGDGEGEGHEGKCCQELGKMNMSTSVMKSKAKTFFGNGLCTYIIDGFHG